MFPTLSATFYKKQARTGTGLQNVYLNLTMSLLPSAGRQGLTKKSQMILHPLVSKKTSFPL